MNKTCGGLQERGKSWRSYYTRGLSVQAKIRVPAPGSKTHSFGVEEDVCDFVLVLSSHASRERHSGVRSAIAKVLLGLARVFLARVALPIDVVDRLERLQVPTWLGS